MSDSLLRRNIGLLIGVVLAGQFLAGLLVLALVIRPQTERTAQVSATMIHAVSVALEAADADERRSIASRLEQEGGIKLRTSDDPPDAFGAAFPSFLDRMFMRSLIGELSQEYMAWRTDGKGQLWMELRLGGELWWVNIRPPRAGGAITSLFIASLVAFIVAVAGGLMLQRRLNRPLRALEKGVAAFEPSVSPPRITVDGPREIAAVARAFNDMAGRIAAHETERALMLAGVSHDLRTPLARLRLALEMMQHDDEELRASAQRQVERIDQMLGQFLDFARDGSDEERITVSLAELLANAVQYAGLTDQVSIELSADLSATLRPMAMCRAVKNLLENAARYGVPPITLTASMTNGALQIAVRDCGAGFDPAESERLLKPFAKGETARGSEGNGLGLAIVSRIVAKEGGHLSFARDDGGFVSAITLPAR